MKYVADQITQLYNLERIVAETPRYTATAASYPTRNLTTSLSEIIPSTLLLPASTMISRLTPENMIQELSQMVQRRSSTRKGIRKQGECLNKRTLALGKDRTIMVSTSKLRNVFPSVRPPSLA